jgi:hypothetical protein
MKQWAISNETLYRIQHCLIDGEQIVWMGKPEPVIRLTLGSRFLHLVSKVGLPAFIVLFVIGYLIDCRLAIAGSMVGVGLTGSVVLAMKQVRTMPVACEEYVLTNHRAFSHFNSNGTLIVGSIPLDSATSMKTCKCGKDCSSLIFKRPWSVAPHARPAGKQPESMVAFLNLRDSDYPMRVAQWAVAQNGPVLPQMLMQNPHQRPAWTAN